MWTTERDYQDRVARETRVNQHDLLKLAAVYGKASPDPSTQNGAVLATREGNPLTNTAACNRFPYGVSYTDERWERPLKYSFIEHAERNAIYHAAQMGIATMGLTLVCPWAACADCARAIIQARIHTLLTLKREPTDTPPRWDDSIAIGDRMMLEAGIEVIFYEGTLGVELLRNGELQTF